MTSTLLIDIFIIIIDRSILIVPAEVYECSVEAHHETLFTLEMHCISEFGLFYFKTISPDYTES